MTARGSHDGAASGPKPRALTRDEELEEVLRIARRASDLVASIYATPFTVELKGPDDPVTRADREANDLICGALAAAFPGDAIVAEESAPATEAEALALVRRPRVWFVDPLDGTREFATRNGEFAVMIGLAEHGRASLGVVVMPTTGDALAGRAETGLAFLEDRSLARRRLQVSEVSDPRDARLMVSRSHRSPGLEPVIQRLGITRVIACGSVGVKVARVATAEADLYVHVQSGIGAKRWDTCAPEAILVGAGGRFTHLSGAPIDYASAELALTGGILASNAALFDPVLALTRAL